MQTIKRIEIVVDAVQLDRMIGLIEKAGASGYTIIKDVAGQGHRGTRGADQPTDVLRNVMIIVAADVETTQKIADALRPLLKRFGGVCLVSDAQWLIH